MWKIYESMDNDDMQRKKGEIEEERQMWRILDLQEAIGGTDLLLLRDDVSEWRQKSYGLKHLGENKSWGWPQTIHCIYIRSIYIHT